MSLREVIRGMSVPPKDCGHVSLEDAKAFVPLQLQIFLVLLFTGDTAENVTRAEYDQRDVINASSDMPEPKARRLALNIGQDIVQVRDINLCMNPLPEHIVFNWC